MRAFLIKKIPKIAKGVGWLTQEVIEKYTNRGLIHRILVLIDVLFGQFGSSVIYITISARIAKRCQDPSTAPLWALLVGAILETISPGHLQAAIIADLCRAEVTRQELQ